MIVSIEQGKSAITMGFVREMQNDTILLYLDSPLLVEQVDLENCINSTVINATTGAGNEKGTSYRIDKDETRNNINMLRFNLLELLRGEGDVKRRKLLIDLDSPRFDHTFDTEIQLPANVNSDQVNAIKHVLSGNVKFKEWGD